MKKSFLKPLKKIAFVALLSVAGWACQDDNSKVLTPAQKQAQASVAAQDNSQLLEATQEALGITSGTLSDRGITIGRSSTNGRKDHHHFSGCLPSVSGSFDVDRTHKDSVIYSGTFTVDFGDGSSCTDSTHVRKGKITDAFIHIISFHDSITYSSSETITFEGYTKDSVQLDGSFITKSSSGNPTTVEIKDAKITYGDGTSASWNGNLTYTYEKGEDCRDWDDNTIKVTGSVSGTSREGANFTATITKEIVYKYSCFREHSFVPVSGTIELDVNGVKSTIDFGDGSCDKKYTIETAGITADYTFEIHHH